MTTTPRVLIVGGSNGGIGQQIAQRIAGLDLGGVYIPNSETPRGVFQHEELDVSSSISIETFLWSHRENPFTHMVYTAALNRPSSAMDLRMEGMMYDYMVNVVGFVYLCRSLRQWQGALKSVVAISSDARKIPMRSSVSYCATKAALSQAVAVLGREWANEVRVNAVAPTSIEGTPMTKRVNQEFAVSRGMTPEDALAYELASLPMGRKVTPDEVAHVVVDTLFGPDYLTGATIDLTGGKA